jgi:ABC-type dipeptide/oligopeptide/nickel transport system permease component
MLRAILLRLAGAIPVLFLVACGIFSLLHLAPGDAASLLSSSDAGPEDVERLRALWGLDQPLYVQFGKFLIAVAGVSAPSFWMGILLVLLFSADLHILPSSGRLPYGTPITDSTGFYLIDSLMAGQFRTFGLVLTHLALPAMTLAAGMLGIIARITRSALIDVGQEDFISTAVAKGLSRGQIVRRHLLPNAAIPITTIIGLELGVLMSGTIIVEVIFSWPGVGSLLFQAVNVRDTPLTTGVVVVYTTLFIALNVLIDLFYFIIDPRVGAAGGVRH